MTTATPIRRLRVAAPSRATDVLVGPGALLALDAALTAAFPRAARRLVVADAGVADPAVHERWGGGRCIPADAVVAPAGERAKTREVHARLEDAILEAGLTRDDVLVAVGGGAVLDVAGYAAATARRGIPWAAVPTTVVAQTDAAVGGKTAVNHPRGKNLLGTFHPPGLVVADVRALRTLPARDRVAGLAEAWKSGVAGDPALLALLRGPAPVEDEAWWTEVAARALAVKGALVERDERDTGPRRLLNYGHTVGHALETALGNEAVRHGEAVAIGMGVAAEVAVARSLLPAETAAAQDAALARLGLPTAVPPEASLPRLLEVLGQDKKRRPGARHTMVLPVAAGGLVVVEDVTEEELLSALRARAARGGRAP